MQFSSNQTQYTCPMHPQVREVQPGVCPICGMTLEPVDPTFNHDKDHSEYESMKRRLWICAILSAPLLFLTMGLIRLLPIELPYFRMGIIEFLLSTPVVVWGGKPFFQKFFASLRNKSPNMFTLVGLGTGVAYLFSVMALFCPQWFPKSFHTAGSGEIGLYFESAAVIITLVLLGQVLESKARGQTGAAMRALMGLKPKTARKISRDGSETEIAIELIALGDRLRVKPGERIPVDGMIDSGSSNVNESMITGEAYPVEKKSSSKVIGGTINTTGSFTFIAEKIGKDTLLSQIVKMVSEAQRTRAPIQKRADQISAYFVPIVIFVAVLSAAVWLIFGPEPRCTFAIVSAVSVLIIACPCALGLATPMSIMVATGKGAALGILFKDAESIELFSKVTVLALDKTGTLTLGKPELISIHTLDGLTEHELLQAAASIEIQSEHPLASAIVAGAKAKGISTIVATDFHLINGQGISGQLGQKRVAVGNQELMKAMKVSTEEIELESNRLRDLGQTVISVAINGKLAGSLGIADPIKPTSIEAIQSLKKLGIKVVMLTGDNKRTADSVATQLKLDQVFADALPTRKAEVIKEFQARGEIVAMAGDGINDAPALAQAEVGIAMGTGTDIAMKSAGVTLVKGDLTGIIKARELSIATIRNIKQNLFFAFFYNTIGIPLAAGILYPIFGIILSPMVASLAMSLSSVSVIANALRLKRVKLSRAPV